MNGTKQSIHIHHMRSALKYARYGLGRTAENPTVGCVIVKNDHVVGRGRTSEGGRPHAETQALGMAGNQAKGATAYVTLEPCSHVGKTPPCAQALIDAGISTVFIAIMDTDKRVSGRGVQMLRDAGIKVEVGLLEQEANVLNKGFFLTRSHSRPFISLKCATSNNGKIAGVDNNGEKKQVWITNKLSRRRAHLIRAQHDAIAVGVNTVLIDNPTLTTRLDGVEHRAKVVVFDRNKCLSGNEKIFEHNPLVITEPDLHQAMSILCSEGVTRLLVEGGAGVVSAFLKAELYDQFYWFKALHDMDESGLDAIAHFDIKDIEQETTLKHAQTLQLHDDVLNIFKACHCEER
jgi:diaminohydroxyphosphoribosylaminopyrimidine deaminase/5-amino-6-(5-phosphoribosylamino)uracil reductase